MGKSRCRASTARAHAEQVAQERQKAVPETRNKSAFQERAASNRKRQLARHQNTYQTPQNPFLGITLVRLRLSRFHESFGEWQLTPPGSKCWKYLLHFFQGSSHAGDVLLQLPTCCQQSMLLDERIFKHICWPPLPSLLPQDTLCIFC